MGLQMVAFGPGVRGSAVVVIVTPRPSMVAVAPDSETLAPACRLYR